jgi:hypothetical protein
MRNFMRNVVRNVGACAATILLEAWPYATLCVAYSRYSYLPVAHRNERTNQSHGDMG